MQPSPTAETVSPCFPSFRCSMSFPPASRCELPTCSWRTSASPWRSWPRANPASLQRVAPPPVQFELRRLRRLAEVCGRQVRAGLDLEPLGDPGAHLPEVLVLLGE